MSLVLWPSTVPLSVLREGYEVREAPSVAASRVDDGVARLRRTGSADLRRHRWLLALSGAQRTAFAAWFRDTLSGGVTPFLRADPVSGVETRYRFVDPVSAPPVYAPRGSLWIVALDLVELPS